MKPILISALFFITYTLSGQLPPVCAGGSPSTTCANACINCNFNGYSGSTAGFPSDIVPNFCGTVENAQWMGFIAGADHAMFVVTPSNCANGDGVQIALYEDCMGQPLACEKGEMNGGNLSVSLDVQVSPGHNYFLLIDGYAGDQCDFSVSVSPANAVYEPPLGNVGQITGPTKVCPGATMAYTVTEVFGAGAYTWSGPPGAMIDTLPLPVTQTGAGSNTAHITFGAAGGSICVQAANSCNQTPCSAPFPIEILDDSHRPALIADTTAHLTCSGDPAILDVQVQASSGFAFQWQTDSTGHIVAGAQNRKATVDKTGTYTLLVTNNQNGCTSSIDIHVGEPDTPKHADIRLQNIRCYGFNDGMIAIEQVQGGLAPFLYSLDGQDFAIAPAFKYLPPGSHSLVIETADECRWDTVLTLVEPEELLVNLGADTTIHLGQSISLAETGSVNDPGRITQMLVNPASLTEMLCENCDFTPVNSFRYTVTAVDSNGCMATDDRVVSVSKERYVFVPNVFAPGTQNEGNQVFTVYGGEDVERVEMLRVFDRWGQMVFEKNGGFAPNTAENGWDGSIRGKKAAPAVFVWQAEIVFKDGEVEKRTGNVTLVR